MKTFTPTLNASETEQLTQVLRTTADRRQHDRVQAVLMASRGRTALQIAEDLAVDPSTVRRWVKLWREGGLQALEIRWGPGKRPLIDEQMGTQITQWVLQGPEASGVDRANWTSASLAQHLAQLYGVHVSERAMRSFCQRHNIRPYRPTYVYLRADPQKQEQSRRELSVLKKPGASRPMRAAQPGRGALCHGADPEPNPGRQGPSARGGHAR
jgi:transposase